ncbi:GNAT family N-acetyltransferase [Lipingzhangella sp. LS1_29]|uniref:GNAT family N-acetyltransferase n=1 Tax=Lipingzhangella rawalii TaxID=2055835 RepID=A0ABU2HA82_9ACTN|nr:GNAT family N-acetyltransferase [Lipingzhangella rawalii]MDS1272231.1 GNAT family N-acetyltransferase [Lipingzhangella rawalii]
MSSVDDTPDALARNHTQWAQALDQRLPPEVGGPTADETLVHTVPGARGPAARGPAAQGYATTHAADPATLEATWGPLRQHRLRPLIAADNRPQVMAELLTAWRAVLPQARGEAPDDVATEAAMLAWPTRDPEMPPVLDAFGFEKTTTLAVLDRQGMGPRPRSAPPSVRIRPLSPHDADVAAAAQLWLGEVRFDTEHGALNERPETAHLLWEEMRRRATAGTDQAWLADDDGRTVALATVDWPDSNAWLAPRLGPGPFAYIGCVYVQPEYRGTGVGSALVREVHARIAEAGVPRVALHFADHNPISPTFWTSWGYEPLWTMWRASLARFRPAAA